MATYPGRFLFLALPATEWAATDPVLKLGEFGVADPGSSIPVLKVGDNVRPFSALPSLLAPVQVANDYVVGTTTTLPPGSAATVYIDNAVDPPTMSFGLPSGPAGPANSLAIGTVTTAPAGGAAAASITGTPPAQTLNLTIPTGAQGPQGIQGGVGPAGPPNSLAIGTVTTGAPGSAADATITGAAPAQTLNLTIPTGAQGPQGAQGIQGPPGNAAFANPTGVVGLVAVPGVSPNAIRSDGAPALSQLIVPNWQRTHTFTPASGPAINANGVVNITGTVAGNTLYLDGPAGIVTNFLMSVGTGSGQVFYNKDAAADEHYWLWRMAASAFTFSSGNDLGQPFPFMNFQRIGATVVAINVDTTLSVRATSTFVASFESSNVNGPRILLRRSGSDMAAIGTAGPSQFAGGVIDALQLGTHTAKPVIFYANVAECARFTDTGALQVTGTIGSGNYRAQAGVEIGHFSGDAYVQAYNRGTSTFLTMHIDASAVDFNNAGSTPALRFAGKVAFQSLNDTYLRLNPSGDFTAGVYTPGQIRADGGYMTQLEQGLIAFGGSKLLNFNNATMSYGTVYVAGASTGFAGYGINDGLKMVFMSNGSDTGIYGTTDSKWLIRRGAASAAFSDYPISAPGFTSTSSRDIKRETGAPSTAANILARLRPILYRLLDDESREQLGLIAEEVQEVCPQLSDGRSVAYDRLAILLLAAWQEARGPALTN